MQIESRQYVDTDFDFEMRTQQQRTNGYEKKGATVANFSHTRR